jgi:hypothetical protein
MSHSTSVIALDHPDRSDGVKVSEPQESSWAALASWLLILYILDSEGNMEIDHLYNSRCIEARCLNR